MFLPHHLIDSYKVLPQKHKTDISTKYRIQFAYKSNRRFKEILKQGVHITPEEHEFLTETIKKYSDFFKAYPSQILPCNHFQIIQ